MSELNENGQPQGPLVTKKSLGQIAWEAWEKTFYETACPFKWEDERERCRERWSLVAAAVADEVRRECAIEIEKVRCDLASALAASVNFAMERDRARKSRDMAEWEVESIRDSAERENERLRMQLREKKILLGMVVGLQTTTAKERDEARVEVELLRNERNSALREIDRISTYETPRADGKEPGQRAYETWMTHHNYDGEFIAKHWPNESNRTSWELIERTIEAPLRAEIARLKQAIADMPLHDDQQSGPLVVTKECKCRKCGWSGTWKAANAAGVDCPACPKCHSETHGGMLAITEDDVPPEHELQAAIAQVDQAIKDVCDGADEPSDHQSESCVQPKPTPSGEWVCVGHARCVGAEFRIEQLWRHISPTGAVSEEWRRA